ncbi:MAG: RdgB/HAM1 family non-canonical purine NTP pyrophosphatase [Candidatus Nanopelagicaceae bacterium]
MEIVLATRNKGKIRELERIFASNLPGVKLLGTDAFPDLADVAETEDTFEGNALLKARAVSHFTNLPAIADDSGLAVDHLGGAPGIFSARYSGVHGDDQANLNKVLHEMDGVSNRKAQFVCAAAFVAPRGYELVLRAEMVGNLIDAPRGEKGFGYDPIFIPIGFNQTTGEMDPELKDSISHRGKAMRELAEEISREREKWF